MRSTSERRGLYAGLAALLLLGLGWFAVTGGSPDADRSRVPDAAHPEPSREPVDGRSAAASRNGVDPAVILDPVAEVATSPLPSMPRSLRGTEVDGGLTVGPDGHFVPDPDAWALFNYYFSASGEEPDDQILQRIRDHIVRTLDPPAEGEALALLATTVGFREALRDLSGSQWVPEDLDRRLQWLRELRREHFGSADAEALFGAEETRLQLEIERRRVAQDESLSPEARAAELEALEMQRPEAEREARRIARAPTQLGRRVAAMRRQGASEDEIHAARASEVGPEAADRLAALDVQRDAWQARLDSFRHELHELQTRASEAQVAPDPEAVEGLLQRHFEAHEIRRVRAIEGL